MNETIRSLLSNNEIKLWLLILIRVWVFPNKYKIRLSVLSKDATSKTPRVAQKFNITFVSQRQRVDAGLQWRLKPFILMPICSWFTILKMFFFVFSSQFCSLTAHNIPNNGLCFIMRIYTHTAQFCVLFYLWLGTFFFSYRRALHNT